MPEHASRELGIVSNCWKVQLDQGQSLEALIEHAVARGFRNIELRQGCLGTFESAVAVVGSTNAARDSLARLSRQFPDATFNLAVSVPYAGGELRENDPRLLVALDAATTLAAENPPHLRLVDTDTRSPHLNDDSITQTADVVAAMTMKLVDAGGRLSIEHAYQSWSVYASIMQQARQRLGTHAPNLQCCFDPCNLLLTETPQSVPTIVDVVTPKDVSMIHLKQRRDGQIQPDVSDGDLDWHQLLRSLDVRGHCGPWLFEVAPHAEIWSNLRRSIDFLFG
jgi:sugar phosphate isomerase/epimerase